MAMTDMTRAEIFRMGVVTQQLGVRDETELVRLIKDGMAMRFRAQLLKHRLNEMVNGYLGLEEER